MTSRTHTLDPGLQRERTSLAWTRTTLAVAVNGVLVLVRHDRDFPLGVSAALASICLVVAAVALVAGVRRSHIEHQPNERVMTADVPVLVLGSAVLTLAIATFAAIAIYA